MLRWQSLLGTLKLRPSCHSVSEFPGLSFCVAGWVLCNSRWAWRPSATELRWCALPVSGIHRAAKRAASAVLLLDLTVRSGVWESIFSHCLTARDSHTEDLAVAHSGFSKKDWFFCLFPTNCDFSGFYFLNTIPYCFQTLWYCRLEWQGGLSIPRLVLMLVQEEAAHGPGTKFLASLRNSHLTCIWYKCTLQFIELLIMNTVVTVQ